MPVAVAVAARDRPRLHKPSAALPLSLHGTIHNLDACLYGYLVCSPSPWHSTLDKAGCLHHELGLLPRTPSRRSLAEGWPLLISPVFDTSICM